MKTIFDEQELEYTSIFADDTNLIFYGSNLDKLKEQANEKLNTLLNFLKALCKLSVGLMVYS